MISLAHARARQEQLLSDLKAIVEMESPSSDKGALDHLAEFLASRLEHYGGHAQIHSAAETGITFRPISPESRIRSPCCCWVTSIPFGTSAHSSRCRFASAMGASGALAFST